jgi:hypothetical protein
MSFETAWATRTCVCGAKILKGETHFARYISGGHWRWRKRVRKNYCMICAQKMCYGTDLTTVQKYLEDNQPIYNRLVLSRIKHGGALK